MHDPVQGKGLHHILNDLLCERAQGRVSQGDDDDGGAWLWNGEPVLDRNGDSCADGEVSYGSYLRAKYPLSSDPVEAKTNKTMRKLLRQDFTSPGNPGVGFAKDHAALLIRLQLPAHDAADARVVAAGLDESMYHFMIPAFFRLLQHLHARGAKFNLVFRTFGDDLHRIAQEFNLFCSGQHPFYSPGETLMDGSDGSIDRRLHLAADHSGSVSHRHGTFYRSNETTALVMGTFQQPKTVHEDYSAFYKNVDGVEIIQGVGNIHDFLTKRWRDEQATLAIRDFYPHWFGSREDARAGKLMTVDNSDRGLHAVFFDDNILVHEPHIVDARHHPTGDVLSWRHVRDLYLLRVDPLEAVRDERYFINRLAASLGNRPKLE